MVVWYLLGGILVVLAGGNDNKDAGYGEQDGVTAVVPFLRTDLSYV